jgi:hypothetical protein
MLTHLFTTHVHTQVVVASSAPVSFADPNEPTGVHLALARCVLMCVYAQRHT